MMTKSGVICDVCDKCILPLKSILGLEETEMITPFTVKGIREELHCCNKCKELLRSINGNWKKLPDGRLRKAFEKARDKKRGE